MYYSAEKTFLQNFIVFDKKKISKIFQFLINFDNVL